MNWMPTVEQIPEEGRVVETISPTGIEQRLKFYRGLWFFEDGSMYVYYVPTYWREKDAS